MRKTTLCAVLFAAAFGVHCAQAAQTLRVATESTFPPFEYVNTKTGDIEGFDMDLIRLLAKKAGYNIEIANMGFDAIVPGILTNTVDIGAAGISITPQRAKRVLFTDPYYTSGLSFVIRAEDKTKLKSIKDLDNQPICVQIGTSGAMRAAKISGATVRTYNGLNEAYTELLNGGCRAVLNDKPVNGYFMAKSNKSKRYHHVTDESLKAEEFGFAVSKERPELLEKLNKALREARKNGEYQALYTKYFGE